MDLRGYPYMPLHIARLQRSRAWLRCKRKPELAFYLMNLWMRAWHEVPAGSIENDDEVLADAAMCPEKLWNSIKGELLRGWEVVGDRIQHPVITEIAASSYESRQKDHRRTQAATEARKRKHAERMTTNERDDVHEPTPNVPYIHHSYYDDTLVAEGVVTSDVTSNVTFNVTSTNRIEEREKDKDSLSSLRSDDGAHDDPAKGEEPPADDLLKPSAPKAAKPPATGTRLAEDWNPGKEGAEFARGLGVDAKTEFEKFRDYWLSKPGKDGRKVDWHATWRNWCRNAGDRVRPGFSAASATSGNRAPVLSGSW